MPVQFKVVDSKWNLLSFASVDYDNKWSLQNGDFLRFSLVIVKHPGDYLAGMTEEAKRMDGHTPPVPTQTQVNAVDLPNKHPTQMPF